jgi:hypothetical protein
MYEFSSMVALMAVVIFLGARRRRQGRPHPRRLRHAAGRPYLGLAGTVLYTAAGPLVPALDSDWIKIHVFAAILASGAFLLSGVVALLYLLRVRHDDQVAAGGTPRFPVSLGASLPAARALDRVTLRRHRLRLPDLDLRDHRRAHLGRGGLGPLLGLGPQGDLVVHHLGAVRRLPARPRDRRVEGHQGGLDQASPPPSRW